MLRRAPSFLGSTIRLVQPTTRGQKEDQLENASLASRFSFQHTASTAFAIGDGCDDDEEGEDYGPLQGQEEEQEQVNACEDWLNTFETARHCAPDSRQHSTWVRVQGIKNAAARYRCMVDSLQMRLMQSLEHRVLEGRAARDMALGFAAERKMHEENLEKALSIIVTLERLLNRAERSVNDTAHPAKRPNPRARDLRHKRSASV